MDTGRMAHSKTNPLRVGVIGLGPRWRNRYRPALAALSDCIQVTALCDQVAQRAAREAKRQGCTCAAGPTALLESSLVEAVLLLDPQWHRLWPVQTACRMGKPVFCCGGLDLDDGHAEDICREVRERQVPFMIEVAHRQAPALRELKNLLQSSLGPARLLVCELAEPVHLHSRDQTGTGLDTALLSCCRYLIPEEPVRILASVCKASGLASWHIELHDRRAIQITRYSAPLARSTLRFLVVTERATATAELRRRLRWHDGRGAHVWLVPDAEPVGNALLHEFYRVAREGAAPEPGLDEASRLLSWLRAAALSRQEGRRVEIREMVN
jgi:predicted dehydrogenase